MKPTKGQWKVYIGANSVPLAVITDPPLAVICKLDNEDMDPAEIEANANLIAAAKPMLLALTKLVKAQHEFGNEMSLKATKRFAGAMRQTHAAIKIAKGES